MKTRTINFPQGSNEWLAYRATHWNASEASIALGQSPYTSRADFLAVIASGDERAITRWQQKIFDKGHAIEAATRPIAERIVGAELFAETIEGEENLSASLDGITMDRRFIWECKQHNEEKMRLALENRVRIDDLIQVQQQLLITGAERCLYTVGDGTDGGTLHVWVDPDPELQQRILEGWRMFAQDVQNYQPTQEPLPAPEGVRPESLPALRIEVEGRVLATNLEQFREHAIAVFDAISTDLQTDQDFADAEAAVKWCSEVEGKLKAAKEAALAQTSDIDALFRALDDIAASARQKRLSLDRLIKARKDQVRSEIQEQAVDQLRAAYAEINATLTNGVKLQFQEHEFRRAVGDCMKGKRTVKSWADAAHQALTDARLAANSSANTIRANLSAFAELAKDAEHLFPDIGQIASKSREDFEAAIKLRIHEHEQRMAVKAEAERKAKEAAEARAAEEAQRRQQAEQELARQREAQQAAFDDVQPGLGKEPDAAQESPEPSSELIPLGRVNETLAPLSITAAGLSSMGFDPDGVSGSAKLYDAAKLPQIWSAISVHFRELAIRSGRG